VLLLLALVGCAAPWSNDPHASAGDIVTVRGREATDMVSICQIGPIFEATEVFVE
jgi:hypothetical protein